MNRFHQVIIVILFAIFLLIPAIGSFLNIQSKFAVDDRRVLATCPSPPRSISELTTFPTAYDAYISDHFGFRCDLVFAYNYISFFGLGISPEPTVILGKHDWLFNGGDSEVRTFRRVAPLSEMSRAQMRLSLELLEEWSRTHDIKILFAVIPNKSTVYDDYMPTTWLRSPAPSRRKEVVKMIRQAGLNAIDLTLALREGRKQGEVYHRLDSHWNRRGALTGIYPVLEQLKAWYPAIQLPPRPETLPASSVSRGGDLADMFGFRHLLVEQTHEIAIPTNLPSFQTIAHDTLRKPNSKGHYESDLPGTPSVVIYHDSFGESSLTQFVAGRVRKLRTKWGHRMNLARDGQEDTDVIVVLFVERMLLEQEQHLFDTAQLMWIMRRICPPLLCQVGENQEDLDATFAFIRKAKSATPPGYLMFGRYDDLPEGHYDVTFSIKRLDDIAGPVARIDAMANWGEITLNETSLTSVSWQKKDTYEPFTISFDVPPEGLKGVECRVYFEGNAGIAIDSVKLSNYPL